MDLRCICTKAGLSVMLIAPMILATSTAFAGGGGPNEPPFAACTTPAPGAGNCLTETPGIPGCTNADCCNTICDTVDEFCCDSEWDGFCVAQALALPCQGGTGGPGDTCDDALPGQDGANDFDTTGMNTNGPAHPPCQEFQDSDQIVHSDIWFSYTSSITGDITFSTCGTVDYDSKIAVYKNAAGCTDAQLTAAFAGCDDDSAGCVLIGSANPFSSVVRVAAVPGDDFLIRVGGFSDADTGTGDLLILPEVGGGPPGCGQAPNDCETPSETPGCSGNNCCTFICSSIDFFCCTVAWDQVCVDEAGVNCFECTLNVAGLPTEGIACGTLGAADPNGGCNVTPAVFSTLALNTTVTGTISTGTTAAGAATRDTDWWQVSLPASLDTDASGDVQLRVLMTSEFPGIVFVDNAGPCGTGQSGPANFSTDCNAASLTITLDVPGDYRIFVSSASVTAAIFAGLPCGGSNDYTLRASVLEPVVNFCGPSSSQADCEQATTNDTPGCQDAQCCGIVCGIDPFCCEAEWDADCATEAGLFCNTCNLTTTGATATEPEACGDNANGGCNATPPAFTPIANNATVHGTAFTVTGGTRDTDWYTFNSTAAQDVDGDGAVFITLTLQSEFPGVMFLAANDDGCPVTGQVLAVNDSSGCEADDIFGFIEAPASFIAFVSTGTVAAGIFTGVPCGGTLGNDYLLTLEIVDNPPPPANDNCTAAIAITDGVTEFSTIGATTEAATPALPESCDKVGDGGDIGADIWFLYTAPCTGTVTVSLCEGTAYDSRIAAYQGGTCGAGLGTPVACADDSCGTFAGPSTMTFDITQGTVYRLRIGGFSLADDGDGAFGDGVITITSECDKPACPNPACVADINGNGTVNGVDLGIMLLNWSTPAGAPGCGGASPCCADLNGNGTVDGVDLGILLLNFTGQPGGDPDCL